MSVYKQKQNSLGYYRALRRQRKMLNRRLRNLDLEINNSMNESNSLRKASLTIRERINILNNATFFSRLKYAITGNMDNLQKEGWQ